jgi:L-alanine-DL-glutamate epimerase-like enolase superfamily enzyme
MKINEVSTTIIHYPEAFVFQDATVLPPKAGAKGCNVCFVHVKTDEGIEGLSPAGASASANAVRAVIEDGLKKVLLEEDPFAIEYLWNRMFWTVRGYGRKGVAFCAISSVDIALWDLKAKALGLPLYRLLGPYTDTVPIYGSGGWTNLSEKELVKEQVGYVERGIKRVKMKVGKDFGTAEEEDIRRLAAVRRAVGDDVEVYVDANNGYYAKQAIVMSRRFEDYNVKWFEEPVLADDIDGLAIVSRSTNIPVATGEHEYTKYGFKDLISRGGADIVQPDVGRVGGVTEWMKVAHLAHSFNLPVAPHAMQLVHLHLACATPNLKVVEYLGIHEPSDSFFYTDVPKPKDGMWSPYPDKPGLGLELNPDVIKKYRV